MIEEIRINNLGVIEQATLSCDRTFTVITGETGAGKTMLISALGLLTGARADTAAIRYGAQRAEVEATFILGDTEASEQAKSTAAEAGAALERIAADKQELLISRSIGNDGRSKAYAGGRTVPASLLGALGEKLVAMHGQNDQILLKSEARQRNALDAFGADSVLKARQAYQKAYQEYHSARQAWESAAAQEHSAKKERAYLQAALTEMDKLAPEPGEEEKLRSEIVNLAAREEIRSAAFAANQALSTEEYDVPNAIDLLVKAAKALEAVAGVDRRLSDVHERLTEVSYLASDIAAELAQYFDSLDEDAPARLEQAEQRRSLLAKFVRDYAQEQGDCLDDVIAWGKKAGRRLAELNAGLKNPQQLKERAERLGEELKEAAALLTTARKEAAVQLSAQVTRELGFLAMERAQFAVDVSPLATQQSHGADKIGFLLSPHPGAVLKPLEKGASGGELSRVMLALEVSLAQADPVDTFIFDEVDTGVGGKTAAEIGKRLALLARKTQVLAVTHSPQIAAFATRQIQIFKDENAPGDQTVSDVRTLDGQERVTEIARMLAGKESSESAQAHAVELLHEAADFYARHPS